MKEKPYEWSGENSRFDFDDPAAEIYLGKYILIGLTILDAAGQVEESVQMHGVVQSASANGFMVSLKGQREGTSWNMPPDVSAISPAQPGHYQLPETGETVENPDFIATWMIQKPRTS